MCEFIHFLGEARFKETQSKTNIKKRERKPWIPLIWSPSKLRERSQLYATSTMLCLALFTPANKIIIIYYWISNMKKRKFVKEEKIN